MKKLFILLLVCLGWSTMGQSFEYNDADAKLYVFWPGTDTINEEIDTIIRTYPKTLDHQWKVYFSMTADSLSGSPAGVAYLQGSYKYSPEDWVNLDTLTFNGAGTYTTTYSNSAYLPLKMRLYAVTTDTLSVIRLTEAWVLLKRN